MSLEEFNKFFKPYSQKVDSADNSFFWKLSDRIIQEIILRSMPPERMGEHGVLMDAGGGTGRWICNLSRLYRCKFLLYDLSEDMLRKADENISQAGIKERVKIIKGDLAEMKYIETESVDHIVSIYSPISFIYNKEAALKEMFRVIKRGGKIIIMGHGYYNALYSKMNNYFASPTEIKDIEINYSVKWAEHVPPLNVFSKESMEDLLLKAGFEIEKTYGVPVFIQPGPEDFDPDNKERSKISKALEKEDFFQTVFNIEMANNYKPTVANRGMNIFSVAKK